MERLRGKDKSFWALSAIMAGLVVFPLSLVETITLAATKKMPYSLDLIRIGVLWGLFTLLISSGMWLLLSDNTS